MNEVEKHNDKWGLFLRFPSGEHEHNLKVFVYCLCFNMSVVASVNTAQLVAVMNVNVKDVVMTHT